jgi:hypothetical protein
MCTYSYYHHHHHPPCQRPLEIFLNWTYCKRATPASPTNNTPTHSTAGDNSNNNNNNGGDNSMAYTTAEAQPRRPCSRTSYAHPSAGQIDPLDPCASGGCVASPDCISGVCRLEQLGGCWVCCVCKGTGNGYTWCAHTPVASPDSFCYHVVCANCSKDDGGGGREGQGSGSGGGGGAAGGGGGGQGGVADNVTMMDAL